jgi:O-antigen ligase
MNKALGAINLKISLFIVATIPMLFASVQPWVWSVYCLLMIAAFLLHIWASVNQCLVPRINAQKISVTIFFVLTLILCLPFPYQAIAWLSPARAEILSQAWKLTGEISTWSSFSYLPGAAFGWWVYLLSLGLFYIVMKDLFLNRKMLKCLVFVMISVGFLEAVYGLIQALVPNMGVLWVDYIPDYLGTARGTFINRNSFAAFIEMIWPLALGITLAMTGRVYSLKEVLRSDKLNRQALMALGIIVFLLALLFTRSRAGIVSGLVGFLAFSIMARSGIKSTTLHTRILLGGIIVLLCIYAMSIGVGPIMQRFLILSADSGSRMDIWRDSLSIIYDHPLGIGLGNYENVFHMYNRSLILDKTVMHAHNDYLQMLAETGWIGFLALLSSFFMFLGKHARCIRKIDHRRDPLRFYLAVGAFSGLISITVHCLFDFNLQIPANCVYFVALMALLSACTRPHKVMNVQHRTPNIEF